MGKYLISWGIVSPVADSLPRTQDTCQFKNRKVHSVFTKPHHCPVLKSIWYPCKLPRHVSLRPIFYVIVPSTSLFFKCSVSLSFKLSNVNFITLSWQYKSWSLWLCGFLSCPLTGPPYVTISSPPQFLLSIPDTSTVVVPKNSQIYRDCVQSLVLGWVYGEV
jgi:hypothetical protein